MVINQTKLNIFFIPGGYIIFKNIASDNRIKHYKAKLNGNKIIHKKPISKFKYAELLNNKLL